MKYGAFDVSFTIPVMSIDARVGPAINLVVESNTGDGTAFVIARAAYSLMFEAWTYDLTTGALGTNFEQCSLTGLSTNEKHRIRIVGSNSMFSLYVDDRWMFTFSYTECTWSDSDTLIYMHSSEMINLENVIVSELNVSRTAIYIEIEKTSQSAIDGVIQERPIEAMPGNLGGIRFSYNANRSIYTMPAHLIKQHRKRQVDVPSACSDAIVYFSDIAVIEDTKYEDTDGFATRIFRLSNLDADAVKAARVLMRKLRESQVVHEVLMRADPRIECGDRVQMSYYISGTGTLRTADFVVEEMNYDISTQGVKMTVAGRIYDP